jgi:Fic family protein
LPDADLFVFMYVRKEAVLSSQIEGTQSSLNDLLEAEANIRSAHRPRDVDEVLNYVNAMNYGIKRLTELPFSIWKCMMAPPKIIDYMVVHELCHMPGEISFGEVDKVMPDYGERKMWLKKHGAGLDI